MLINVLLSFCTFSCVKKCEKLMQNETLTPRPLFARRHFDGHFLKKKKLTRTLGVSLIGLVLRFLLFHYCFYLSIVFSGFCNIFWDFRSDFTGGVVSPLCV